VHRLVLRLPLLLLITLGGQAALLLVWPLQRLAPTTRRKLRNLAFRAWGRLFCRIVGMRLRVEGEPPAGAFFLVANHVSYLDIPVLASRVDAAFVAKADLQGWPLLGWIFATADTIFIDRGRKRDLLRVMEQVKRARRTGLGVVVFPEGTSGSGARILPLKPSLLELAARRGEPVHYATLHYRTPEGEPPAQEVVCWWNDMLFLPHILRLLRLRHFDGVLRFGEGPVAADDRKELARDLHAALDRALIPIE
jgi:1-acyl-sn-glycerol-3-phosphate acyltransferase